MDVVLVPLLAVIDIALNLFVWALIISAILSWLVTFNVINTSNQFVSMVGHFLYRLTEPALRPIRRFMPDLGGIDLSPIVLILIIYFLRMMISQIIVKVSGI